ncbi:hypothetical protein Tco_0340782 [Tanacetum coccineum]
MENLKAPRRLVLCNRLAVDANSNRMERQMLVHFQKERDAKRADARELMRLIVKVEECMNHMVALIREVEILTGGILVVQATSKLKRAQERDVEKLSMLKEKVFEARRDVLDNTVFMTSLHGRLT